MKYSVLLAALLAVSMTACSKEETTTVVPAEAPLLKHPLLKRLPLMST
jgi:hypothetical protein